MIQDNNYLNIQGFMIKDLHLKGNELLVYALIYGFCQDGESKFTGSLSYIAEWITSSRQTVINTLNSLEEKGLIIKEQEVRNNITFNKFSVVKNFDYQSKIDNEGSKKILPGVVKKFDPINNIDNDNNKKEKINKKKEFTPPTLEEVKEYFASRNLREDVAIKFYEYYTAGNWSDGKGDKIKNWKQKVIAVWDKDEYRLQKITSPTEIVEEESEEEKVKYRKRELWFQNCRLLNGIKSGKLLMTNLEGKLLQFSEVDKFAKKIVDTMTVSILTEEQLQKIKQYLESKL